jgi:hypothetical protein
VQILAVERTRKMLEKLHGFCTCNNSCSHLDDAIGAVQFNVWGLAFAFAIGSWGAAMCRSVHSNKMLSGMLSAGGLPLRPALGDRYQARAKQMAVHMVFQGFHGFHILPLRNAV